MDVKPIGADEGLIYRDLRLRALADSPDAFGDTLEHALGTPRETWIERAREIAADGGHEQLFIARDNGIPCGTTYVRMASGVARIYAMWVDPAFRRRGIASGLLATATAWAENRGATLLELWVTAGNDGAARLYERAGFQLTGRQDALRPGSKLKIHEMARQCGRR